MVRNNRNSTAVKFLPAIAVCVWVSAHMPKMAMEVNQQEMNEVVDLVHSLVLQSRSPLLSMANNGFDESLNLTPAPSKIKIKSVPNSPCNLSRAQSLPVRKKVQIKSAPLKPPDINNSSLFPSVEETAIIDAASSSFPVSRRIPFKSSASFSENSTVGSLTNCSENVFPIGTIAQDKKLKTLEAKLTEPLPSSPTHSLPHRRTSLNLNELAATPTRKTPRSAKLFSELSTERRQHLDDLAVKYGHSIDSNQCRNILDELEFLFQLFNTSAGNGIPAKKEHSTSTPTIPLLCSAAEQAYFVIKVVINQLDKLFVSIPPFVLQLIIDNYPHKIPKPVRKHIEDWLETEKKNIFKRVPITVNDGIPIDPAKTVTFQSEKDGRANFYHQTDFHGFCKQRDLFYSIRESWSNTGSSCSGGSTGMIMDRNKSRMSFPPPAPSTVGNSASAQARIVDTLSFKVQSLFQMNSNSTNLFHMASLFVSHYLLEARAVEVGGVPKDDTMKEFFQSNPTKLLQLNSRFSTNSSAETLDGENGSESLAFQKQFLLASSPKFIPHVVDRLVKEILKAEEVMKSVDVTNLNYVCRLAKDTVHLARLLGFAHFLPYLPDETKLHNSGNIPINSLERESVLQEHVQYRSYHVPPIDLKAIIENAFQSGRLSTTCPWIVEYLLQCDPVTLILPAYQPILRVLLSLYKNVLVVSGGKLKTLTIPKTNINFLRFHLGVLFSSSNFPDTVFALLKTPELLNANAIYLPGDNQSVQAELVDQQESLAHNLLDFFFVDTFNRFKRILSWGKLEVSHPAITGEFRHIRPIPATSSASSNDSKKSALISVSKEKILQTQLEATFFELYPPSVKRSVDFIAERMTSNFVGIAKSYWFPTVRTLLQNQGVFGVRAAEKCRMRITEEMNKYLTDRCSLAIKLILEQSVTVGVLGLCQKITVRKATEAGTEWIKNYITAAMFPDVGSGGEIKVGETAPNSNTATVPKPAVVSEDPPFEILILLHRTLRKLNSLHKVDPQLIDKVLSCQTLSRAQWTFVPLLDWGMALITYQPQLLDTGRTRQLVAHWKNLWNSAASSKILNSRNLMLIAKSANSRDSWIKLGSITQHLIAEGLIKADEVEQQCMQLLHEDWPDQVHRRISEFLTIVLESFKERSEYHASDSTQVLEWVAWLCSGQPDQED